MLLIESDVSMIDEEASIEENAIVGCDVKNLGMLEDVARVNHIFCDKTGTLTCNIMELLMFSSIHRSYTCDLGDGSILKGVI